MLGHGRAIVLADGVAYGGIPEGGATGVERGLFDKVTAAGHGMEGAVDEGVGIRSEQAFGRVGILRQEESVEVL